MARLRSLHRCYQCFEESGALTEVIEWLRRLVSSPMLSVRVQVNILPIFLGLDMVYCSYTQNTSVLPYLELVTCCCLISLTACCVVLSYLNKETYALVHLSICVSEFVCFDFFHVPVFLSTLEACSIQNTLLHLSTLTYSIMFDIIITPEHSSMLESSSFFRKPLCLKKPVCLRTLISLKNRYTQGHWFIL